MARFTVEDRTFVNDNGDVVKYKRFVIRGVLQGEVQAVELGIDKNQAVLVKMLLNSKEEENVATVSHQPYVSNSKNTSLADEAASLQKQAEQQAAEEDFQQGFSI